MAVATHHFLVGDVATECAAVAHASASTCADTTATSVTTCHAGYYKSGAYAAPFQQTGTASSGSKEVTLVSKTNVAVGQFVAGPFIAADTTVKKIEALSNVITLSSFTLGAVVSRPLTFHSSNTCEACAIVANALPVAQAGHAASGSTTVTFTSANSKVRLLLTNVSSRYQLSITSW